MTFDGRPDVVPLEEVLRWRADLPPRGRSTSNDPRPSHPAAAITSGAATSAGRARGDGDPGRRDFSRGAAAESGVYRESPAGSGGAASEPQGQRDRALGTLANLAASDAQGSVIAKAAERRHRAALQATARHLAPRLGVGTCMLRPGLQPVTSGALDLAVYEQRVRETGEVFAGTRRELSHRTARMTPNGVAVTGNAWGLAEGQAMTMIEKPVSIGVTMGGVARWQGLHTCGSAWVCPWCAPRVSDGRRQELVEGLTGHRDVDTTTQQARRGVAMLSVTTSHTEHDSLVDLRTGMLAGWRDVTGHRDYRELRAELGGVGTIRATELTHGGNGWHLHFHIVWLQETPVTHDDAERIRSTVYRLWDRACRKHGLGLPQEFERSERANPRELGRGLAVDVGRGSHPDEYVSKWGAAEELTLNHVKEGRGKASRTPWALLLDAHQGDALARRLWLEFACAMKGKAQLVWSKGLKARLGVNDRSDAELAGFETERPVVSIPISHEDFFTLLRDGSRLRVLEVAEAAVSRGEAPEIAVMAYVGQVRDRAARDRPDQAAPPDAFTRWREKWTSEARR